MVVSHWYGKKNVNQRGLETKCGGSGDGMWRNGPKRKAWEKISWTLIILSPSWINLFSIVSVDALMKLWINWVYKLHDWFHEIWDEVKSKGYAVRWCTYQYPFFSYHFCFYCSKEKLSWWLCVKMNYNTKFLMSISEIHSTFFKFKSLTFI